MQKKGKKGIIIAIIIFLVIALLAGGVYAYLTTDLFKSNKTLFFNYMAQAVESMDYVENTQTKQIEQKKEITPYTVNGNLIYMVNEQVEVLNLKLDASVNKLEEKSYAKTTLSSKDQELFNLEYANSNNIYALKSDEIVSAFLGIENNNLKVLAQKLGITDTTAIPDEIQPLNLSDLLSISKEEKEHIQKKYLDVLVNTIEQENFTKTEGNDLATIYSLNLTKEEVQQVEIALLQALKEDSITLNLITTKAKQLNLDEKYTQINQLTNEIQNLINNIQNGNIKTIEGLNIEVHTNKRQVISTKITIPNQITYTINSKQDQNGSTRYLLVENLDNSNEKYSKLELELQETKKDTESTYTMLLNIDNNIGIDVLLENIGTQTDEKIQTKCEININEGKNSSNIIYEQETTFVNELTNLVELDQTNCGVLNNYTTEQLQALLQAVGQRTQEVITSKLQAIIVTIAQQTIPDVNEITDPLENNRPQEEIDAFNAIQQRLESQNGTI